MIAITDASAYSNIIEHITPTKNINLSEDVITQHLTDSAIINSTITNRVKTMLVSIVKNGNVSLSAKTKIAEYSGFSLNSQGNIVFSGANASINKLTFYVIFRLPYTHNSLTYDNIGNGNTLETIPSDPTTWGRYANYIRTLTGSGIRKINSAGEQVNNNGVPVDDNDNSLENWYKEVAYNYLGENPFNGSYTIPSGLYPATTEKAMLFGQNNEQPNAPGEQSLEFTKIPLYFYLLAKVENPYNSTYWLNPSLNSIKVSRIPHWPSNVTTKIYRKHFVKKTSSSNVPIENGPYTLLSDFGGNYFIVSETNQQTNQVTNHKIYVEIIDVETLTFENLNLNNANKIEKNSDGLLAIWENHFDYPILSNNSGLTFGMGVDIGASLNGIYRIEINIVISGNGTFRLYSGSRRSESINTNVTCSQLKSTLATLLNISISSKRITVVNSSGQESGTPAKIIITRQNDDSDMAYNHRIYVYDLTSTASIQLTPSSESERWKELPNEINDSWFYYNKLINSSYSNNPPNDDYWLDQLNISQIQRDNLKKYLKRSFGCRSKSSYHIWSDNKELIKKIEIKSYVRNLRASYHEFFIPRYYNLQRTLKDGSSRYNGKDGISSVQHLLNDPKLNSKPNQAEFFAVVLLNYNLPSLYRKRKTELINAINEHSISKLKKAIRGLSSDRITALNDFIGPSVKLKLYHEIED